MPVEREFNGTCEPVVLLNCDQSIFHLDPCDCSRYYQCVNDEVVPSPCGPKTFWDPLAQNCQFETNVGRRDDCQNPWTRCNVSEWRLNQLQGFCTNTTVKTTPFPTSTLGNTSEPDGGGVSAGVVGGVVAALVAALVVLVIIIVVMYRRRQKNTIKRGRDTMATNPEYFEGGNENDPYDFITENRMHGMSDPTYRGFSSNGTLSSSLQTGTLGEPTVYDNSATRDPGTSGGYTSTLDASQRTREPSYETLARANNANVKQGIDNNALTDDSGAMSSAAGTLTADAGTSSGLGASSSQPDYYTLSKSQT